MKITGQYTLLMAFFGFSPCVFFEMVRGMKEIGGKHEKQKE